jgi:hypothetical protein
MDLEMGRAGHVMGFRFCTARFEFEGLLHYKPAGKSYLMPFAPA